MQSMKAIRISGTLCKMVSLCNSSITSVIKSATLIIWAKLLRFVGYPIYWIIVQCFVSEKWILERRERTLGNNIGGMRRVVNVNNGWQGGQRQRGLMKETTTFTTGGYYYTSESEEDEHVKVNGRAIPKSVYINGNGYQSTPSSSETSGVGVCRRIFVIPMSRRWNYLMNSGSGQNKSTWKANAGRICGILGRLSLLLLIFSLAFALIYYIWPFTTGREEKVQRSREPIIFPQVNQMISDEEYKRLQFRLERLEDEMVGQQLALLKNKDLQEKITELEKTQAELEKTQAELKEKIKIMSSVSPLPPPKEINVEELEETLMPNILSKVEDQVKIICTKNCPDPEVQPAFSSSSVEMGEIENLIAKAINKYDSDKTGLPDLVLEPSGGSILSTRCTKSSKLRSSVVSLWGIPIWSPPNNPRVIIQPGVVPGECWSFEGSIGDVVIKLSTPSIVTGFTMEHIPKAISPYGHIDSAPNQFQVLGLHAENDLETAHDYGTFKYEDNGKSLQYFSANVTDVPYPMVELKILSNHGNLFHTCLYRFRVHGQIIFS